MNNSSLRRAAKIAGWAVGAVVALLVAVMFAVWLFVNPNDYKGRIIRAVKTSTGRDLSLPGNIKLSVFPWIALEIGPATLGSPPGFDAEPFAALKHATLSVRALPLLRRQLQVGRVRIDGLDLRLKKNEAGQGNWENFGQRDPAAANNAGGEGEALQGLAGLVITDGHIAYQDLAVEHFNLDVGKVTPGSQVPVTLALDLRTSPAARPIHIEGQLKALPDMALQRHRLQALQVKGTYTSTPGAAALPWRLSVPELRLDLAAKTLAVPSLSLELGAARISATLSGSQLAEAPRMSGSFALAPLALRDYLGRLAMPPPATRDARALSELTARGNFLYGGNALRADALEVRLDDSTMHGNAAITNFTSRAINFNLAIDRIDLDRYRSPVSAASGSPVTREKAANVSTSRPKFLDASGTMRIGAATVSGMKFANLSIGVRAKDGVTRIAPATAQLYGGQCSGTITLDERTDQSTLNIDQTMTSIEVLPLLHDFAKTNRISGRGNVTAHLAAHGRGADDWLKTLGGHVDANLANGAVEGIDVWYEINRAQSLLKQQALPAGSSTGRTAFDTFRASAELNNGVATTKDLNVSSQLLRLTGGGYTNLVTEAIAYEINATVLKTPAGAQSAGGLTLAEIPVKIAGTLSRPTVRPDLEAIARKRLQQEINKHKGDLENKLQQQLQNLIRR